MPVRVSLPENGSVFNYGFFIYYFFLVFAVAFIVIMDVIQSRDNLGSWNNRRPQNRYHYYIKSTATLDFAVTGEPDVGRLT